MSIFNFVQDLQNFQNNLENILSDRLSIIQGKLFNVKDSGGNNLFSPTLLNKISSIRQQYKALLDPRIQQNRALNQMGNSNRVIFDPNNLYDNEDYFSNLQTLDIYKVNLQGKFLRGLLGSKEPVYPMIFNVVLPDTAQFLGVPQISGPLYLFVNPSSWARSNTKVQGKQYVRNGIKIERWGEELEQVAAEGSISGFYTQETGLTRFYRKQTPSFRNLMELVQIYRSNGCVYGTTYTGNDIAPPTSRRIIDVGFVEILYGYELFRGTFESFSINENSSKPFSLQYSFVFNASEVVSIFDMINASSEFYQYSDGGVFLEEGQIQSDLFQIQQRQTTLDNSAAVEYNNLNEKNQLSGQSLSKNADNSTPIYKIR